MNRVELRLRVFEAIVRDPIKDDEGKQVDLGNVAGIAIQIADILDPPRKTPARNAKGRFASRTAQDAAEDEEIHAMAQALPEERHPAVDPYAPLRSFDVENGWSP